MHGQAGAAAKQGMDPIAAQQWSRMVCGSVTGSSDVKPAEVEALKWSRIVCGSVTGSGIGIGSAPSQDGSTIDNQIASADQTAAHGTPNGQDKEGLKGRRSCRLPAFA